MVKVDYEKVEKELGSIPTKKNVIKMLKRVEKIRFFRPQREPSIAKLKVKVDSILKAFKLDISCEVETRKLDSASAWDSASASAWASARASARASAWASARASAWDSARDSARASAWASARDSAWDSAWDSASASARVSAWVSAWASAWDSASASDWEVVADLQKEKGYKENPFAKLLELWEMGLYPVGLLKDGKFHIYYVPLPTKKKKEKRK